MLTTAGVTFESIHAYASGMRMQSRRFEAALRNSLVLRIFLQSADTADLLKDSGLIRDNESRRFSKY